MTCSSAHEKRSMCNFGVGVRITVALLFKLSVLKYKREMDLFVAQFIRNKKRVLRGNGAK